MTMKEEMLKVQNEGKIYISPYKLNGMMQTASKIVKLLTVDNGNNIISSYEDMKIIMKMVDKVLEEHTQAPQDCTIVTTYDGVTKILKD